MNIAVLIPCYNEKLTITKVISDFRKVLPDAKIYVYDNNSTDETADLAIKSGAIVRKEYVQGKGNVVRSMFRDITADCYILVDGDDTYPAESANDLVSLVESGYDMVIGDRLSSTYFTENKRLFHNFGNKLVKYLVNGFFGGNMKDIMTGYRAFNRKFVKSFPVVSAGFEIETEMTIHTLDKRFSYFSIPVLYKDRPIGSVSKLNTIRDGVKVVAMLFKLLKDFKPFYFFTFVSFLLMILSLILFVPVLIDFTNLGIVPRYPTLIVSGFVMLTSIISFFVGLILDTLIRLNRQQFELQVNMLESIRRND